MWVLLSYGITLLPFATPMEESMWRPVQHDWLAMLRSAPGQDLAAAFSWEACLAFADASKRTWQGWEQGRKMPYFKAAALAYQLWQMDAEIPRNCAPYRWRWKLAASPPS